MGFLEDTYGINDNYGINPNADLKKNAILFDKQNDNKLWVVFVDTLDKELQTAVSERLSMLFDSYSFDGRKCTFICYGKTKLSSEEFQRKLMHNIDPKLVSIHAFHVNVDGYFGSFHKDALDYLNKVLKF